ncbi:hypothetical protein BDD12DRAFT_864548 [Trichophaea hybrida]|nr:hypothetical protein BDD12DRAFT_864548 [Trichophaea hybrida]
METRMRVLGDNHPDTLTSMNNLSLVLSKQGQWKEAEELQMQVIDMSKRVLGDEHPDTLTSIANLAIISSKCGRRKKAEEPRLQFLEAEERLDKVDKKRTKPDDDYPSDSILTSVLSMESELPQHISGNDKNDESEVEITLGQTTYLTSGQSQKSSPIPKRNRTSKHGGAPQRCPEKKCPASGPAGGVMKKQKESAKKNKAKK